LGPQVIRRGSLIITDNVVRNGAVIDAASNDPSVKGVRRFHQLLAAEPRVSATAIQTVAAKVTTAFVSRWSPPGNEPPKPILRHYNETSVPRGGPHEVSHSHVDKHSGHAAVGRNGPRAGPARRSAGESLAARRLHHRDAPYQFTTRGADKKTANADNVKIERQLDEEGRATAIAMGKALRELKIPVGEVLASPTYRALETVRYAQLGNPRTYEELGDGGQSMQGGTEAQARGSKRSDAVSNGREYDRCDPLPEHDPRISAVVIRFGDGEALVFVPTARAERVSWRESRLRSGQGCGFSQRLCRVG